MKPPSKVITLMTDFGTGDPFVAEMKGTILKICPDARIVDLTHDIPPFDVRKAAFLLARSFDKFPEGTVHVVVVDPGVGTPRKPVLIVTRRYYFVGPDNGVLSLAASKDGIEEVREIASKDFMLPVVSSTFHGRDIFAPTAARLACGFPPSEAGPLLDSLSRIEFPAPKREGESVVGEVIYVDRFGNLVTNVPPNALDFKEGAKYLVEVGGRTLEVPFLKSYGFAEEGELLLTIGSFDLIELAANLRNASRMLGIREGAEIKITPKSP